MVLKVVHITRRVIRAMATTSRSTNNLSTSNPSTVKATASIKRRHRNTAIKVRLVTRVVTMPTAHSSHSRPRRLDLLRTISSIKRMVDSRVAVDTDNKADMVANINSNNHQILAGDKGDTERGRTFVTVPRKSYDVTEGTRQSACQEKAQMTFFFETVNNT